MYFCVSRDWPTQWPWTASAVRSRPGMCDTLLDVFKDPGGGKKSKPAPIQLDMKVIGYIQDAVARCPPVVSCMNYAFAKQFPGPVLVSKNKNSQAGTPRSPHF
jgi:hypothetical protein